MAVRRPSDTTPIKSSTGYVITDRGQQMERWVEHFSGLYSVQNTVTPAALDAIEELADAELWINPVQ